MIDILLLAILGIVTWCVASEGAFGAVTTLLATLFAGLLAMNFFEPLAVLLERTVPVIGARADMVALVGLFVALVFAFRLAAEYLSPTYIQVMTYAHEPIRWVAGVATGYLTMAFLLTALHTAPVPREFIGFRAERMNLFGAAAPDRQWLAMTQYVSEKPWLRREDRVFDALFLKVGDQPNVYWSSFPIRYAHRRERLSAPAAAARPAAPVTRPAGKSATPAF